MAKEKLTRQEKVLKGSILHWLKISTPKWEADHCTFCLDIFAEGFATEDNCYLVCTKCFKEFRERLNLKLETKDSKHDR